MGANPVDVAISPDGAHAYVTKAGAKSVSVIDTAVFFRTIERRFPSLLFRDVYKVQG